MSSVVMERRKWIKRKMSQNDEMRRINASGKWIDFWIEITVL